MYYFVAGALETLEASAGDFAAVCAVAMPFQSRVASKAFGFRGAAERLKATVE